MSDYAGRLIVHDREMHLETTAALHINDRVEVVRGNGPREGDRMGTAIVTAIEDGSPVLAVRLDVRVDPKEPPAA